MFRIIFYFLIFYIIYTTFKKLKPKNKKKFKIKVKPDYSKKEKMIRCENCGLYSPESSIVNKNGKNFCSQKCAQEFFKDEKI